MENGAGGRVIATAGPNRLLTIGHLVVWSVAAVVLACVALVVQSGVLVVVALVSALQAMFWGWLCFVSQVAQLVADAGQHRASSPVPAVLDPSSRCPGGARQRRGSTAVERSGCRGDGGRRAAVARLH